MNTFRINSRMLLSLVAADATAVDPLKMYSNDMLPVSTHLISKIVLEVNFNSPKKKNNVPREP